MKKTAFALLTILISSLFLTPVAFSQDSLITSGLASGSFAISTSPVTSSQDKIQALESTRFHFITLKQFHSSLFTAVATSPENKISESQAQILNAALNSFLTQAGRETLLLEALRQNRSVRLQFNVPQQTNEYQIIDNPDKPLAYQFKPVINSVPATIEIKPILDKPVAFQITLKKGSERYVFDVDWSGRIICITCLH